MIHSKNQEISDEELMSYADGECEGQLLKEIEAAVLKSDVLKARVELFKSGRIQLKAAFPLQGIAIDQDPIAQMILKNMQHAQTAAPTQTNVVQLSARQRPTMTFWQTALAASLAVGVGLGFLQYLSGTNGLLNSAQKLTAAVQNGLNSWPSGSNNATPEGEVIVIASYKSNSEQLCREFVLRKTATEAELSFACRKDEVWETVFHKVSRIEGDSFMPAGDEKAVAEFLEAAALGEPLSAEEELKLLNR